MVGQSLQLKQSQNLVMTQQLQQSLKVLQLSTQELGVFIEGELEKNPLLEQDEGQLDGESNGESGEAAADSGESDRVVDATEGSDDAVLADVWANREDASAAGDVAVLPSESHISVSGSNHFGNADDRQAMIEESAAPRESLQQHLLDQILIDLSGADQHIGIHLIDLLDAAGYFIEDIGQIAENLGCQQVDIERVLASLKCCDPAGVFASDLAECLALQLRDRDRLDPAMAGLLENLNLVADGDVKKLSKICAVDELEIREMCAEIRQLNPKPGTEFTVDMAQVIEPDMFVYRAQDGSWKVELNNNTLPRLLVNNRYYADVKSKVEDESEKEFIKEQHQNASWLVRALEQRAQTMIKVASALIYSQQAFFEKGVYHLKPMIFQDIADMIDMHESTVGRVVNHKYMATPRGVFELRYFFTSSIKSGAGGEDVSSLAVKQVIKKLIDNEPVGKVFSDEKLADALQARGMDIARRTVAKYREAMHIPTSAQRKRQKRLGA